MARLHPDSAKINRSHKYRRDAIAASIVNEARREAASGEERRRKGAAMTGAHTFGLPFTGSPRSLGRVIEQNSRVAVIVRDGVYLGMFRIDSSENRF